MQQIQCGRYIYINVAGMRLMLYSGNADLRYVNTASCMSAGNVVRMGMRHCQGFQFSGTEN